MIKKMTLFCAMIFVGLIFMNLTIHAETEAVRLETDITISTGGDSGLLADDNYETKVSLSSGTSVIVRSETPIDGLYLVWDKIPGEWFLEVNGETYVYGKKGFLHEYVKLPEGTSDIEISISEGDTVLCDVIALSSGFLPSNIQNWEEPCEKSDIIVFSTHADDEQLFFGGLIAHYAGEVKAAVQVVYLVQYWTGPYANPQRNHEALNGLWTIGIRNYPIVGHFEDYYSRERGADKSPALALSESQYDVQEVLDFVVEQIRRFKPQVAVGHDLINGEYGHGAHMLFAKKLAEALEISKDPSYHPSSTSAYGVWDVPKTYLHLYDQNKIWLDLRKPLEGFAGKTALEVAQEGFNCHKSQLYIDVARVDDDYYLSCADFGLYRSLVGPDQGKNDILENIVLYKDMEPETFIETPAPEENSEREDREESKETRLYLIFILVIVVVLGVIIWQVNLRKQRKNRRRKK